jgi:hypothetical protein
VERLAVDLDRDGGRMIGRVRDALGVRRRGEAEEGDAEHGGNRFTNVQCLPLDHQAPTSSC